MDELEVLNKEVSEWTKDISENRKPASDIFQKGMELRKRVLENLNKAKKHPSGAELKTYEKDMVENADLVNEKIGGLIYQGKYTRENLETELLSVKPLKAAYTKEPVVTAARCSICAVCSSCATCGVCGLCIITGIAAATVTSVTSSISVAGNYG